jgi:hypothetical protein
MEGVRPFWCLFAGCVIGGSVEIDFAAQNLNFRNIRSGNIQWKTGTDVELNLLVQLFVYHSTKFIILYVLSSLVEKYCLIKKPVQI